MKTSKAMNRMFKKAPLALALASAMGAAHAVEFNFGDLSVQLDNNVSYGVAWRTEKPDAGQIMQGNAEAVGIPGAAETYGSSYNYDDGTLNYKQGDVYTNAVKWSGDLEFSYQNYGAFFRARAWYDTAIMDEKTDFKPLVDGTKSYAGSGAELLDAFVWADYTIGDTPVNIRLGRQVVNWGESTFIQGGINSVNPVDASAFRRPGAEVKEGLLPVNMVYTSIGLTGDTTLEAFYQLEWEKTRTDPCGTFFSTVDFVGDGCGPVILGGEVDERDIIAYRDFEIANGIPLADRVSPVTERISDAEPKDDGQFGLALRTYSDLFGGTEFGLYYMNIHSRVPYISGAVTNQDRLGVLGGVPGSTAPVNADATYNTYRPLYQIAYPEDIQIMGVSFATSTASGASISGEISYKPDLPLQWNAFELILAGNGVPWSRLYQQRAEEAGGGVAGASSLYGELAEGWDKFDVWQGQMTFLQFFENALGADRLTVVAEVGMTYVQDLPSTDEARYGRSGAYGIGNNEGVYAALPANVDMCSSATVPGSGAPNSSANTNVNNCTDEGYVTELSGGIRLRAALDFNNAFAGVNMIPNLALGYDKGYGPEPGAQFIDDRLTYYLGVSFVYLNNASLDLAYTGFEGDRYDQLKDRDNVSMAIKYAF